MATTWAILLPSCDVVASASWRPACPWARSWRDWPSGSRWRCGRALGHRFATFRAFGFRLHQLLFQVWVAAGKTSSRTRRDARQAVPNGHQPLRRPTGDQFCQFLRAGEGINGVAALAARRPQSAALAARSVTRAALAARAWTLTGPTCTWQIRRPRNSRKETAPHRASFRRCSGSGVPLRITKETAHPG
jgi:hypothetical protein